MKLFETPKFSRRRKKLRDDGERQGLREAVRAILDEPLAGKPLKGEFAGLRSLRYQVRGRSRRLIYKVDGEIIHLFTFGPREGVYRD